MQRGLARRLDSRLRGQGGAPIGNLETGAVRPVRDSWIPAYAGMTARGALRADWIPAYAGMTGQKGRPCAILREASAARFPRPVAQEERR